MQHALTLIILLPGYSAYPLMIVLWLTQWPIFPTSFLIWTLSQLLKSSITDGIKRLYLVFFQSQILTSFLNYLSTYSIIEMYPLWSRTRGATLLIQNYLKFLKNNSCKPFGHAVSTSTWLYLTVDTRPERRKPGSYSSSERCEPLRCSGESHQPVMHLGADEDNATKSGKGCQLG